MSSRCTAALALFMLGAICTPAFADDAAYCSSLKRVLEFAKTDFVDIRGESRGPDEWAPTIMLDGQESCSIEKSARIRYTCESNRFDSEAAANDAVKAAVKRAHACLGRLWDLNDKFSDTALGQIAGSYLALNDLQDNRSVIFAPERDGPFDKYLVSTRIARMNQQPLEPPAKTASQDVPQPYCTDLKRVVTSGSTNFEALIKGAEKHAMGRRNHWLSNVQVAGFEDCWVHEEAGKPQCRYVACSSAPLQTQADAEALRDRLGDTAKACLGSGWTLGRKRDSDGIVTLRIIGGPTEPYIELTPARSLYTRAWRLKLDFNNDLRKECF